MKKRVLGFDVSSSCIGYCLLEIDTASKKISYIDSDCYKPPKNGDIFERLYATKTNILKILEKYKPDYVGIENIVEFMRGKSGAKTILILSQFNRVVGLTAFEYLGKSPQLFNVMSIRHGLKFTKALPSKEEMPEIVAKHLNIKFPYRYHKQKIKQETFDIADGFAVSLFYSKKLIEEFSAKKLSK